MMMMLVISLGDGVDDADDVDDVVDDEVVGCGVDDDADGHDLRGENDMWPPITKIVIGP